MLLHACVEHVARMQKHVARMQQACCAHVIVMCMLPCMFQACYHDCEVHVTMTVICLKHACYMHVKYPKTLMLHETCVLHECINWLQH